MDITYINDGMFTRFIPESKAGEYIWREMHDKMGHTAIINFEAKKVIAQIRAAGYKVGKAKPVKAGEIDAILAELGI